VTGWCSNTDPVVLRLALVERSRSAPLVVYSSVPVKFWADNVPSAEAVRPSHCPRCDAAAAPAGERVTLVGHGLRYLQQGGSADGSDAVDDVVAYRRYRCRSCGSVVRVLPAGLLAGTRYRASAVLMALVAWAIGGIASAKVRERVCGLRSSSHEATRYWAAPKRWLRRAAAWWQLGRPLPAGDRRAAVESLLQQLAARARDGTGELLSDALRAISVWPGHGVCAAGTEASTS